MDHLAAFFIMGSGQSNLLQTAIVTSFLILWRSPIILKCIDCVAAPEPLVKICSHNLSLDYLSVDLEKWSGMRSIRRFEVPLLFISN